MTPLKWVIEEEKYLALLHKSSHALSASYKQLYITSRATQNRYRFPAIVMSSVSGLASFGTSTFPENGRPYVSIAVGCVNILIAILNTWEAFTKVAEIVNQSLLVSNSFKKLADDIHCELSVPVADRETSGITYLRDTFTRYQQILDQAPPLDYDVPNELAVKMMRRDIIEAIKERGPATYSFQQTPISEPPQTPASADADTSAHVVIDVPGEKEDNVVLSRGLRMWQTQKQRLLAIPPNTDSKPSGQQ